MRAAGLMMFCILGACTRDPAGCPVIATGDLVITEIRSDDDPAQGPWIELFNASGRTLDLAGVRVSIRDDTMEINTGIPVIVRRPLTMAAGDYIVLGAFFDGTQPEHVDYGFLDDFEDEVWRDAATIDLFACGEPVDIAEYDDLPAVGTFSFGVVPPDAVTNDIIGMWCIDATPTGTPGAANNACP